MKTFKTSKLACILGITLETVENQEIKIKKQKDRRKQQRPPRATNRMKKINTIKPKMPIVSTGSLEFLWA
ncbi:hypothetical protein BCU26_016665 [Vibrio splendidus]|uniref:hypothetical protein n=1 Tax=Vibrio splendidus TaxID=29497 RepID=UPI000C81BBDE|nr:hypothetical protein [Vibrio splendidus]PMH68759.1 hypothetical protein BCU61_16860 [Vibrio splendidus]PMJ31757.1 hypothetical protein BCU26_02180 [Vibrio splendidus]